MRRDMMPTRSSIHWALVPMSRLVRKSFRDLVFGMEVPKRVQVQAHRVSPEIASPPSTRMISPLIHAASGWDRR